MSAQDETRALHDDLLKRRDCEISCIPDDHQVTRALVNLTWALIIDMPWTRVGCWIVPRLNRVIGRGRGDQ